jgi:DNA-directed RNA polymerase subunit RPC12/RpoP
MTIYRCDWCGQEFPLHELSTVEISNCYSSVPETCHICQPCADRHMPKRLHPMISWTAPISLTDARDEAGA